MSKKDIEDKIAEEVEETVEDVEETVEEKTIEEEARKLNEKIQKAEKEKDEVFLEEYKGLCQKHKRHLSSEIRIREGVAPVVYMFVERKK